MAIGTSAPRGAAAHSGGGGHGGGGGAHGHAVPHGGATHGGAVPHGGGGGGGHGPWHGGGGHGRFGRNRVVLVGGLWWPWGYWDGGFYYGPDYVPVEVTCNAWSDPLPRSQVTPELASTASAALDASGGNPVTQRVPASVSGFSGNLLFLFTNEDGQTVIRRCVDAGLAAPPPLAGPPPGFGAPPKPTGMGRMGFGQASSSGPGFGTILLLLAAAVGAGWFARHLYKPGWYVSFWDEYETVGGRGRIRDRVSVGPFDSESAARGWADRKLSKTREPTVGFARIAPHKHLEA